MENKKKHSQSIINHCNVMQSASCIQVFTFVHPLLRLGWIVVRTLNLALAVRPV